jgi:hypothetical protein
MDQPENSAKSLPNVDIAVKIQANLDPLVNATPKGLSTLLNLLFKKKYPEASRQAMLSEAQNRMDVQRILEGKATFHQESGALIEAPNSSKEIRELVREGLQEEEITNLISCTVHAASNISNADHSSETEASSEFLNRWRNEAKFISENAAQAMWGRILSEEVNSPNSISIRTLDVIKALTREEAEAFRDACKFIFFGQYLLDPRADVPSALSDSYAMLADAGLVAPISPIRTQAKWMETTIEFEDKPTKAYYLQVGKLFIYIDMARVTETPTANYLTLTKAGREMYRIISREIEYDAMVVGTALTEKKPAIRGLLKYAVFTNVEKKQIDFNTIRSVFLE